MIAQEGVDACKGDATGIGMDRDPFQQCPDGRFVDPCGEGITLR